MPETSMWCSTRSRAEHAVHSAALCMLLACLSGPAHANTGSPAQDTRLASSQAGHPQLPGSRLQGEATLRYFGLRVYHARLWTRPDFRPAAVSEQPLVLELEYLRDLKGSAIAERSLQEMRRAGNFTEAQGQRWLADMQRIFTDVKAGDRLSGQHLPGAGVRFWLNGRLVGQVDDAQFAQLFLGIWLAPTTSEPDLRIALLGQSDNNQRR